MTNQMKLLMAVSNMTEKECENLLKFLDSENELSVSDDQKKHSALHDVSIRNASDHSDEASQTSGELPLRSRTDDGNVCENCGKYKPEYCEYCYEKAYDKHPYS